MIPRVSLFRLSVANGRVRDRNGDTFDATSYSRFKYGDAEIGHLYAARLVEQLLASDGSIGSRGPSPVITTAPFKRVPTASFHLARQMQQRLQALFSTTWESPITIVPLYMRHMDTGNYSGHGQLERKRILDQAGLHVDPLDIRGRRVLLVDDAIVSGTAEQEAIRVLTGAGASSVAGAYVIELEQESGRTHPEIEDHLNQAFVRDLEALLELFRTTPIELNIRTVKFVLGWPVPGDVQRFFNGIAPSQLAQFSQAVMEDEVSFWTAYPDAVKVLLDVGPPAPTPQGERLPPDAGAA